MTVFQTPYQQQSDEALCALAAQGDGAAEEALISRYTRMVRRLSRPLFLWVARELFLRIKTVFEASVRPETYR